jgi:hypothetical protein
MCFAVIGVGAMAFKAFVREDRPDVEIIADFSGFPAVVGVVGAVEAGYEDEDSPSDQGQYGGNALDGDRFPLKIKEIPLFFMANWGVST